MLQEAAPLIRSLGDTGIETLLLKGAALILRNYEDAGLRPMADLDVMVRKEQITLAFEKLAALGWQSREALEPATLAAAHSAPFIREGASPLDLHWRLLEDEAPAPGEQALWDRATPAELFGVPTRVLGVTDQLLHVLAHGARWSADRSHRWLADASVLLSRAKGEVDWELLAAEARRRRVSLAAQQALDFLRACLNAPVPQEALDRLSAAPVARLEKWEHQARMRPPERRGPRLMWALHYQSYRRLVQGGVLVPGARGLLCAVGREWGVASPWLVPFHAIWKGLRRMAQLGGGWWRGPRP
jgi:hypothetical protein